MKLEAKLDYVYFSLISILILSLLVEIVVLLSSDDKHADKMQSVGFLMSV